MLIVACFIGGSVAIPLISTMICYATEISTLDMMNIATALSFIAEALTSIVIGFYFMYLKDTAVFYLIISILLTFFAMFYAVATHETPHFLFKLRRYNECLEHLRLMGDWNGYTGYPYLPTVE
jgi:hypothetical protein